MKKRALISVFDKTNVAELAQFLVNHGYEIVSTGGTLKYLQDQGIEPIEIDKVTGFPEILDGRVKTLNPYVHGGILAKRSKDDHMSTLDEHEITPIDVVVVNLYPFFEECTKDHSEDKMIEFIDIGGPTMLRSAAKSFEDVLVLSDVNDYQEVMDAIQQDNVTRELRKRLAGKVFNLTSAYDAAISNYLLDDEFPPYLALSYRLDNVLRYGENPHQQAAFYKNIVGCGSMTDFEQLGGKELSFNNIRDMDVAWKVVSEYEEIACCALKHSTPCGVAIAYTVEDAYEKAYEADPVSIFGGIVAFNSPVNGATANKMNEIFLEIVVAPEYTAEALEILKTKKNLRVIKTMSPLNDQYEVVQVDGGILVQNTDNQFAQDYEVVTEKRPTDQQMEDLLFAQKVVKHAKSNAIVVAKDGVTLGIGTGQVNRIWAAKHALQNAVEGCVMASDAFFPFSDVVEEASQHGVAAIIQPGGSIRDQESIDLCNEKDIPMVFTGMRHFKH